MIEIDITKIGGLADQLRKNGNCIILFNENAPEELQEISYMHADCERENSEELKASKSLFINDAEYEIIHVGQEAVKNFKELGHFSIVLADGLKDDFMPGQIAVSGKTYLRELSVFDKIVIK